LGLGETFYFIAEGLPGWPKALGTLVTAAMESLLEYEVYHLAVTIASSFVFVLGRLSSSIRTSVYGSGMWL
jgi:hypothetical protein